jgi:hypothetical protein
VFDRNQIDLRKNKIGSKDYLEFKISENISIKDFELNMLINNPTLPFIKVEMRQINNEKSLFFDISDKISLKEYIKINKVSQRDFIEIIKNILSTLETAKDYMLMENRIILSGEMIFIEQYSGMPYLMYVPIDSQVTQEIESDFLKTCKTIIGKLQKNNNLQQLEKDIINEVQKAQNLIKLKELIQGYNKPVEIDKSKTREDKKDVEFLSEAIKEAKVVEEKSIEEKPVEEKNKAKRSNKVEKKFESVIEEDKSLYEDYDEEDEEEEDEDLAYEEYINEKKYYVKEKNDNTNRLLLLQLIVVILIGSLVLLLSVDDKQFFMMMLGIIVLDVLFCIIVFAMNMGKKGKDRR